MARRISGPVAALLIAAAVLVVAAGAGARATKEIELTDVGGPQFIPDSKTIHRGDKVRWVWGAGAIEEHDVFLRRAPAGVRKGRFREPAHLGSGFTETSPAFKVKGDYRFVCTFHSGSMKAKVTVKR